MCHDGGGVVFGHHTIYDAREHSAFTAVMRLRLGELQLVVEHDPGLW
jgi:hypothetical protein